MFDSVPCDTELPSEVLKNRFIEIRQCSITLVADLSEADVQLQAMADVSPAKWHLAHTTWFFETFILKSFATSYREFDSTYQYLFNSYYNSVGEQYPRSQRGLISRPSLAEIINYRQSIDEQIIKLLSQVKNTKNDDLYYLMELGLQHEQQHQELLLTDIKYNFFQNPTFPQYTTSQTTLLRPTKPLHWLRVEAGLHRIGHKSSDSSFSFDNENPEHQVFIEKFGIADRLVTNGEYLAFVQAGAYQDPQHWLADGWAWLQGRHQDKTAPLYWVWRDEQWFEFTLMGLQPLDLNAPVTHVNYYEATAYANWLGVRLPTEFEWEVAAKQFACVPAVATVRYHPTFEQKGSLQQMFGSVWQWTSSTYGAYPGFTPFAGNAGEYNGKFMSNQYVLRGSSCVTPKAHTRVSYRNFFYAHQAWQFMGIRLAQ